MTNNEKPTLLVNHPEIESFINNLIDTNHGIQIPAILHSIREMFSRDGVTQQYLDDVELKTYISNILMQKNPIDIGVSNNIGRGVGTVIENTHGQDQNKEWSTNLQPVKSAT
jgi:hypothetical protein